MIDNGNRQVEEAEAYYGQMHTNNYNNTLNTS